MLLESSTKEELVELAKNILYKKNDPDKYKLNESDNELLNIITSESEKNNTIIHYIDKDKKIGFLVAYSNVEWGPEIINNIRILLCKIIFNHKYYDILYDIPEYNVEEYVNKLDRDSIIKISKKIKDILPNGDNYRNISLLTECDNDKNTFFIQTWLQGSSNPFSGTWTPEIKTLSKNIIIDILNNNIELQIKIIGEEDEFKNYETQLLTSYIKILHKLNNLIVDIQKQGYNQAITFDKLCGIIKKNDYFNSRKFKYQYLKLLGN